MCVRSRRDLDSTEVLIYRIRILPQQLDRARRRVAQLEAEALRMGMAELVAAGQAA